MRIKRLKKIQINSYVFNIKWDPKSIEANFCYRDSIITIGTKNQDTHIIFMLLCHELFEICAIEMHVRYERPDCTGDYLFNFDHKQHDTLSNMLAGLLNQFIQ